MYYSEAVCYVDICKLFWLDVQMIVIQTNTFA